MLVQKNKFSSDLYDTILQRVKSKFENDKP